MKIAFIAIISGHFSYIFFLSTAEATFLVSQLAQFQSKATNQIAIYSNLQAMLV
jgi:hypothetical protein